MIVDQNDCGSRQLEGATNNLAWIDWRMVYRASLLHFVCEQTISLVEEQDAKLLHLQVSHHHMKVLLHLS